MQSEAVPNCCSDIKNHIKIQKKMQSTLNQIVVPLTVCWTPDSTKKIHGEIKQKVLFIYDDALSDAWNTFTHEITEYKLKNVTRPYRLLINALIESFEKIEYSEKERFIESFPKVLDAIRKAKEGVD